MGEQSKLESLVRDWISKREATVKTLRVLAEKLMTHHNNVCIAQVTGSASSIAGFVLITVGFGLSFVTFGTSLILVGVGGGVSAAGGLACAGSLVAEACIQKDIFDTAQKIIDEDREATEALQKLLKENETEALKCKLGNGLKAVASAASMIKNGVEISFKLGARVGATAASEGGEALFRGLSVAGRAAHIGGFALSAALLPVDIYTLVTNSMKIDASRKGKKDKEPKEVKMLKKLADKLAEDMPDDRDEEAFARQI